MKIVIEGDITKEDLIEIGKFFREKWKDRKDVLGIFIVEGTEDMSKEETSQLLQEIFRESKSYTEIIIPKNK